MSAVDGSADLEHSRVEVGFDPHRSWRSDNTRRSKTDEQASDFSRDYGQLSAIRSDAFSAIIRVAALVLADGIVGMTDASTTRRPAVPCTFRSKPTTASGSRPMRHVL